MRSRGERDRWAIPYSCRNSSNRVWPILVSLLHKTTHRILQGLTSGMDPLSWFTNQPDNTLFWLLSRRIERTLRKDQVRNVFWKRCPTSNFHLWDSNNTAALLSMGSHCQTLVGVTNLHRAIWILQVWQVLVCCGLKVWIEFHTVSSCLG